MHTLMGRILPALIAVLAVSDVIAAPRLPPIVDPPTAEIIPGKFVWFDLVTADPTAARQFYGPVFGWTFQNVSENGDYTVIASGDRLVGGVFRPPPSAGPVVGSRWLSFASVADVDMAVAGLERLGFVTLHGATPVPGRGIQAIVRDPQGAVVGLMHSASGDPRDEPVAPGEFFWVDLYTRDPAAAAAVYAQIGYTVVPASDAVPDRLLLESRGYARAGITPLPDEGRQPGWLPYVQVESVPDTLEAARAAGGKVLLQPDPQLLDGNVAVLEDPLGGVIGVIHWAAEGERQ
jgi:predicted enzyme related to lactoylglutathione lyase